MNYDMLYGCKLSHKSHKYHAYASALVSTMKGKGMLTGGAQLKPVQQQVLWNRSNFPFPIFNQQVHVKIFLIQKKETAHE